MNPRLSGCFDGLPACGTGARKITLKSSQRWVALAHSCLVTRASTPMHDAKYRPRQTNEHGRTCRAITITCRSPPRPAGAITPTTWINTGRTITMRGYFTFLMLIISTLTVIFALWAITTGSSLALGLWALCALILSLLYLVAIIRGLDGDD